MKAEDWLKLSEVCHRRHFPLRIGPSEREALVRTTPLFPPQQASANQTLDPDLRWPPGSRRERASSPWSCRKSSLPSTVPVCCRKAPLYICTKVGGAGSHHASGAELHCVDGRSSCSSCSSLFTPGVCVCFVQGAAVACRLTL